MLSLRPMTEPDLPLIGRCLQLPHVARWWGDTAVEAELAKYRDRVQQGPQSAVRMLMVSLYGAPVDWCQWYLRSVAAGIDYAIGEPALTAAVWARS